MTVGQTSHCPGWSERKLKRENLMETEAESKPEKPDDERGNSLALLIETELYTLQGGLTAMDLIEQAALEGAIQYEPAFLAVGIRHVTGPMEAALKSIGEKLGLKLELER